MNKKSLVLFSLFLAILTLCTACGKSYGLKIVDKEGMEHIIMTDVNGVTVLDANGNLVEIVTDSANKKPIPVPTENGTKDANQENDYETMPVTFPGVLEEKGVVEDMYCSLVLPEDWEQIGSGRLILRHKPTGAQISVYGNVPSIASPEQAVSELESDMDELEADVSHATIEKDIGGYIAIGAHGDFGTIIRDTYVLITDKDIAFKVTCTVEPDKADKVDFDSILSAISFK